MNLLIVKNPYGFFSFLEKYGSYNCATVRSICLKIRVCGTESCYKKISKIRNVMFIFLNFQKQKKIENIHTDSEKSINTYGIKKG